MTTHPLISVLLVTYNHEKYVAQALASIAAQRTSDEIEVVVADDSSSDGTIAVITEWATTVPFAVRVLDHDERRGITGNYARGFAACLGEFVAVLEGDDEWITNDKLERQSTVLKDNPSLSMSANRVLLYEHETGRSRVIPMIGNESFLTEISDRELADANWFATFSACMYRTSVLRSLPPELFETTAYDWLVNMAVMAQGNAGFVPEVMTLYRQHAGGEWSHKKQLDRDHQLQRLIPEYIGLVGDRVARELTRAGRAIEERIRHLSQAVDPSEPESFSASSRPMPVPRYTRETPPLVSVVMTSYNHGRYILEAINSVLDQTFDDLELIVVDDESTDASLAAISVVDDPRLRVYQLGVNQGAAAALNIAIQQTRGRLVAVINSDDIWEPRKLERQLEVFASDARLGAVFTGVRLIGEDGKPLSGKELPSWNGVFRQRNRSQGAWLRYFFETGNALAHPSVLVRREFYERHGLYDNRLRQIPDLAMWITLVKHYPIHVLGDEELVRYRLLKGEANASATSTSNILRGRWEQLLVRSRFFEGCPDDVLLDGFGDKLRDPHFVTATERECAVAFLWLDIDCAMRAVNREEGLRHLHALLGESTTRTMLHSRYGVSALTLHQLAGEPDFSDSQILPTAKQLVRVPSGVMLGTIAQRARWTPPLLWAARAITALRMARRSGRRDD